MEKTWNSYLICIIKTVSLDSPFGYYKEKAKNLFLNLHYRIGGFPFVHVVEQEVGVKYRFKKDFTSNYIDKEEGKKFRNVFNVR